MNKKVLFLISLLIMINSIFAFNISLNESNSTNLVEVVNSSLIINQVDINPYKNKETKEIKINTLIFIPKTGIDSGVKLKSKLLIKDEKTYAIIQFNKNPSKEEKLHLEQNGILILDFISSNSYYVSINQDLDKAFEITPENDLKLKSNKFNDKYLVRSVNEIKSEYRLSKNLRENNIGNWAKDKDGNIYLTVQFQPDVTLDRAEKLMNEKGFEVISRLKSINALTIKIKGGEKK